MDFEEFIDGIRDGRGAQRGQIAKKVVLDNTIRYDTLRSVLNSAQMSNMFIRCFNNIIGNLEKILEKCRAGKTPKTLESIIPLAQEINIIVDFVNDMSLMWNTGESREKEIKNKE